MDVWVGVGVRVGVADVVAVGVGVLEGVGDGDGLAVGVELGVDVGVFVGVGLGVLVCVAVARSGVAVAVATAPMRGVPLRQYAAPTSSATNGSMITCPPTTHLRLELLSTVSSATASVSAKDTATAGNCQAFPAE